MTNSKNVSCETFLKSLNTILNPYSIFLCESAGHSLLLFWNIFLQWNKTHNLSTINNFEQAVMDHFADSLFSASENYIFTQNCRILDFGTGGGFPGIPLSLLFPYCHFSLLDKNRKKISFINFAASSLDLKNVTGIHDSLFNHSQKYDVVVSRAVKIDNNLFNSLKSLINNSGWLVIYYSNFQTPISDFSLQFVKEYSLLNVKRKIAFYRF